MALISWHLHGNGSDQPVDSINPGYAAFVPGRNENSGYEHRRSLEEQEVINDPGIATYQRVKRCRRKLGQDRFSLSVVESLPSEFAQRFSNLITMTSRSQFSWLANFGTPIHPNASDSKIKKAPIFLRPVGTGQVLMDFAAREDKRGESCYNIADKHTASVQRQGGAANIGHLR